MPVRSKYSRKGSTTVTAIQAVKRAHKPGATFSASAFSYFCSASSKRRRFCLPSRAKITAIMIGIHMAASST